ncbi:MAG: YhdP family protein [Burkholderiaceae bacterium]
MTAPTSLRSSLFQALARVLRWVLWLGVGITLLFTLAWGLLHWVIVPRVGEFRPLVEARASQLLGVPVRIADITARSAGLIPTFELAHVTLHEASGKEALRLTRVVATLSPASLWRLGFEQIYIDRPTLSVRHASDGKLYVAGLDFSRHQEVDNRVIDWVFSQAELAVQQGTLEWIDEKNDLPPVTFEQVNLVLRNTLRVHSARIDATPPALWGDRFTLMAKFKEPLWSLTADGWRDWTGQLYADFANIDLAQLSRYAHWGIDVAQGRGALRSWVDVARGRVLGTAADVVLSQLKLTVKEQLPPLELASVSGRMGIRMQKQGFEITTQGLQFDTRDGLHWPGGNLRLNYIPAEGQALAHGELSADQLDLAALAQIAQRLPLDPASHAALLRLLPKGRVEQIQANWQGLLERPEKFSVKGRVKGLELAGAVRGADVDFDANQASGSLSLSLNKGALEFPGLFDEPVMEFDQLSTDANWQLEGEKLTLNFPNLKFSHADAQGQAQVKWQTATARAGGGRGPGVIDVKGSLNRANGARVYRYLPTMLSPALRHYVRDAVRQGEASAVNFRIKGDLRDMPFTDPRLGEFKISAQTKNVTWAYVPPEIQSAKDLPWPALTRLSGELVFDRASLQLKNLRSGVAGAPGLEFSKSEAVIPDLAKTATVQVRAEARGPLDEMLKVINTSALAGLTDQVLAQSSAVGTADYRFRLNLPLAALGQSKVSGSVALADNEFQFSGDTPRFSRAKGVVNFSEKGFSVALDQARLLGGEVKLEGGSVAPTAVSAATAAGRVVGPTLVLRAQGSVSATGLRQAKELGAIARMAEHANGSTPYSAVLSLRRGVPELTINSSLQGLELNLPEPLSKPAATVLPLQFERALLNEPVPRSAGAPLQDRLTLKLGSLAALDYVRELAGNEARVLRGAIGVGLAPDEAVPLPRQGVAANISLGSVDLDAWQAIFSGATGVNITTNLGSAAAQRTVAQSDREALSYLPTTMAIRAKELTLSGRKLHQIVVGGAREGLLWRANLDASELNGYLEYRQSLGAEAGRVYARLARLTLASAGSKEVETLLEEQPASIPALDIVVDDLELRGKKLGRVEIEAINSNAGPVVRAGMDREWRLNKLNVRTPEAQFSATGNWAALTNAQAQGALAQTQARRRTQMQFKLDIADAGEFLKRFGMKDVVRGGKGKMEGQVGWLGSPLTLDYPTLSGAFHVNVETGQFLKADPGIAKLFGVLNLQALPRRLTLDFRDVFSEGFAFDFFRGDVAIEQGMAKTNNLQMKGVNAAVLMEGGADIAKETQDIRAVVVPEINAGSAALIATAINPAVGLGTFLAQLFLRRPLIQSNTQEFRVTGSWADPQIQKIEPKAADKESDKSEPKAVEPGVKP